MIYNLIAASKNTQNTTFQTLQIIMHFKNFRKFNAQNGEIHLSGLVGGTAMKHAPLGHDCYNISLIYCHVCACHIPNFVQTRQTQQDEFAKEGFAKCGKITHTKFIS